MPYTLSYKTKIQLVGIREQSAVEEYVGKKISLLEKLLSHYAEHANEALFEVEISKTTGHHQKGDVYCAEINFSAGGERARAAAVKDDIYAAIDEAKDEMQRILKKNKDRHLALRKESGRKIKRMQNG